MPTIFKRKQDTVTVVELDRKEVYATLQPIMKNLRAFQGYLIDSATKASLGTLENSIANIIKFNQDDRSLCLALNRAAEEMSRLMEECSSNKKYIYMNSMRVHNEAQNPYTRPVSDLREGARALVDLLQRRSNSGKKRS